MIKKDDRNNLTSEQERFALQQVTLGKSVNDIHRMLSSDDNYERGPEVGKYPGSLGAFRKKMTRLTKGAATNKGKPTGSKKPLDFDLETADGQLDFVASIIKDSGASDGIKLKALEAFNDLRRASGAADGRTMLSNPKNVKLDAALVEEMLMTFRSEIGGLHKLNLSVLCQLELKQLIDAAQSVLDAKVQNEGKTSDEATLIPKRPDDEDNFPLLNMPDAPSPTPDGDPEPPDRHDIPPKGGWRS